MGNGYAGKAGPTASGAHCGRQASSGCRRMFAGGIGGVDGTRGGNGADIGTAGSADMGAALFPGGTELTGGTDNGRGATRARPADLPSTQGEALDGGALAGAPPGATPRARPRGDSTLSTHCAFHGFATVVLLT